jgi:hypothetical protein
LRLVRPPSVLKAHAPQFAHSSHRAPVNKISVSTDTFTPAHPASIVRWVARWRSTWASFISGTHHSQSLCVCRLSCSAFIRPICVHADCGHAIHTHNADETQILHFCAYC